jgi:hypothetical protein
MRYTQYLESEHWKLFREKILTARPICEECKSDKNIHVHHLTYENLWNEKPEDVKVLCRNCHCKVHGIIGNIPYISELPISSRFEAWIPYKKIGKCRLNWFRKNHCYECFRRFIDSEIVCHTSHKNRYLCENCSDKIENNILQKYFVIRRNQLRYPKMDKYKVLFYISESLKNNRSELKKRFYKKNRKKKNDLKKFYSENFSENYAIFSEVKT